MFRFELQKKTIDFGFCESKMAETVESPEEAKTGRMSDTCIDVPVTLLRTDHIVDNFFFFAHSVCPVLT